MNRELAILIHDYYPNDFMFLANFNPLDFDSPKLVCKKEASDTSKILLKAAYKFGHLVVL